MTTADSSLQFRFVPCLKEGADAAGLYSPPLPTIIEYKEETRDVVQKTENQSAAQAAAKHKRHVSQLFQYRRKTRSRAYARRRYGMASMQAVPQQEEVKKIRTEIRGGFRVIR
jgi:hypothetical protein